MKIQAESLYSVCQELCGLKIQIRVKEKLICIWKRVFG